MKIIMIFLLLLSTIKAVDLDWFAQIGAGMGGDTLGEIKYLNAPNEEVNAGSGIGFALGLKLKPKGDFHTALSIGILYDSEDASNGDISYTRFPITLMEYYTYKSLRVGAGATYHLNPHVSGDGFAENASMSMESRVAPVFEVSYMFFDYAYIGLEVSPMQYDYHDKDIDATRVAIVLGLAIPLHKEEPVFKYSLDEKRKKELQWSEKPKEKSSENPRYIVQSSDELMASALKRKKEREDKYKLQAYEREESNQMLGDTSVSGGDSWVVGSVDSSIEGSLEGTSESTTGDDEDERRIGSEYERRFVSNNMDTLAVEIASGSGETLDTLSSLLEVEDKGLFHTRLKEHFDAIYHDSTVSAIEVYEGIVALR